MIKNAGQSTNTQVTLAGSFLAIIFMWLLEFYNPALMDTAPPGLETAVGGLIIFALGLLLPHDISLVGHIPPMPNRPAPEIE